jgi:hypothetical protein
MKLGQPAGRSPSGGDDGVAILWDLNALNG